MTHDQEVEEALQWADKESGNTFLKSRSKVKFVETLAAEVRALREKVKGLINEFENALGEVDKYAKGQYKAYDEKITQLEAALSGKTVFCAECEAKARQLEAANKLFDEASNVVGNHESWDDLHAALKEYEQARRKG